MLAAAVEQKNGRQDDKNGVMPLTKKAPYNRRCARRRWIRGRGGRMLAAAVEQKNGRQEWRDALDKESPIQAVCGKAARTVLCGGREMKLASLPLPDEAMSLIGRAPRRRESSVEEDSTRRVVD